MMHYLTYWLHWIVASGITLLFAPWISMLFIIHHIIALCLLMMLLMLMLSIHCMIVPNVAQVLALLVMLVWPSFHEQVSLPTRIHHLVC
jgi:hypothetical protein